MNNVTLNIEKLQQEFPKTWRDFSDFRISVNQTIVTPEQFNTFPFEYQLGSFLHYFSDSGIDIDLNNYTFELLPSLIEEAFKLQENNISHYS
jgi:hypothetical protein